MKFTYEEGFLFKDESKLFNAYKRLKSEYPKINIENNPIKHSYVLNRNADCVVRSTNVMSAQTDKGVFTKVISIDDEKRITKESIVYTRNDMNVTVRTALNITPLRCAMMACLTCDLNYQINSETVIGFIGNGNINITTAKLLNILFGVRRFEIRGSSRDKSKNLGHFLKALGSDCEVMVDYTNDYEFLNQCDIVISCTSSCDKKDLISHDVLWKPNLFIAQDSGYIFDESFRNDTHCYTDLKEQIMCHYRDEFPYDESIHEMESIKEDYSNYPKSIYLYGIALADAIIYEEIYEEVIL